MLFIREQNDSLPRENSSYFRKSSGGKRARYGKSQAYRLVQTGDIYLELESSRLTQSTKVELTLPRTGSQLRPLQALPKEKLAEAWWSLVKSTVPVELTARVVARHVKTLLPKTVDNDGGESKRPVARLSEVEDLLSTLERAIDGMPNAPEIQKHIKAIRRLGRRRPG